MIGLTKLARNVGRGTLRKAGYEALPIERRGRCPIRDALRTAGADTPCVFDVGANEGQSSLAILDLYPHARIEAFEPFPAAADKLEAADERINVHRIAASDSEGMAKFTVNSLSVTNSLLPNADRAKIFQPDGALDRQESIDVPVRTLDSVARELGWPQIHCLKTDTQGADLKALKGAEELFAARKISTVVCEVIFVELYQGQADFTEMFQWLTSRGMKFAGLYDTFTSSDGFAKWADALFIHNSNEAS